MHIFCAIFVIVVVGLKTKGVGSQKKRGIPEGRMERFVKLLTKCVLCIVEGCLYIERNDEREYLAVFVYKSSCVDVF